MLCTLAGVRAVCAIALCMLAVGCGAEGSEPEAKRLPDGTAEGPGFRFQLSEDWGTVETTEQLEGEFFDAATAELPELDAEAGLLLAGIWVQPGEDDLRPVVNVIAEPVTAATSLESLARSTLAPIERSVERPAREPASLGGDPAVRYAYRDEDDEDRVVEKRGIVAKRGDVAYTLSAQMTGGGAAGAVDELVDGIASSWSWREPDDGEREELSGLSEFEGEGYEVTLPPGWRGTGRDALAATGEQDIEALWRGWIGSSFSTNVNVSRIRSPTADLSVALRELARDERRSAAAAPNFAVGSIMEVRVPQLDGDPAGALELTSTVNRRRLRNLEVVAIHDSLLYRVTLASLRERYPSERRAFLRSLASWRWR